MEERPNNRITICGVEYSDPDNERWQPERINDMPLSEQQYQTFIKGYAPDWECRYAPYQYKDWMYITRSGCWVKKFRYQKQSDGLYHIIDNFTTNIEAGRNLLLEILIEGYFEPSLKDLGIKFLNMTTYQHIFKYYHFEDKNPYSRDDVKNKFWHGEYMFANERLSIEEWKEKGQKVLESASEENRKLATKYTPEQFGLIIFIEGLYAKWCPYDDLSWIYNY